MQRQVKTLAEVAHEINEEEIGKMQNFNRNTGYFLSNFRAGRGFEFSDTKIGIKMNFRGTNQPNSFGYFKSKKGYNTKFKNTKEHANHYGEYISSIILKQLGKNACKVDLGVATIKHPYTNKDIELKGCLSHFQLSESQIMFGANVVIDGFKTSAPKKYRELSQRGKSDSDQNFTNIELILEAFEHKFRSLGQPGKIPNVRKQIFDMCAFDLIYANRDRHDENFGIRIDQLTDDVDFYPLFDNEQILGFQEDKKTVVSLLSNEKAFQKFKEENLTSCIGIPGKIQKIKPTELLEYLLEKYPDEILSSIQDIRAYKLSDLEELMDTCEGLSDEHKQFAKKIYLDREKDLNEVIDKYKKKKEEATLEER